MLLEHAIMKCCRLDIQVKFAKAQERTRVTLILGGVRVHCCVPNKELNGDAILRILDGSYGRMLEEYVALEIKNKI